MNMLTMQAFRYALHHSGTAEAQYRRFAGARRWVWNKGLEFQFFLSSCHAGNTGSFHFCTW